MITDDAIRHAVSTALDKRARAAGNIQEWTYRASRACGVAPRTFEKWLFGENGPSAANLKNLEEHFGTGFKNEIEALGSYVAARREHAEAVEDANALARYKTAFVQIRGVMEDAEGKAPLRAVTR